MLPHLSQHPSILQRQLTTLHVLRTAAYSVRSPSDTPAVAVALAFELPAAAFGARRVHAELIPLYLGMHDTEPLDNYHQTGVLGSASAIQCKCWPCPQTIPSRMALVMVPTPG